MLSQMLAEEENLHSWTLVCLASKVDVVTDFWGTHSSSGPGHRVGFRTQSPCAEVRVLWLAGSEALRRKPKRSIATEMGGGRGG